MNFLGGYVNNRILLAGASGVAVALGLTAPAVAESGAAPVVTVVAKGFDNPRGLAFGPDGSLYVAEAGSGGTGKCATTDIGAKFCFGDSGKVTAVKGGKKRAVGVGLPSIGAAGIGFGPEDVTFNKDGDLLVTIGLGGPPAYRAKFGTDGQGLGTLVNLSQDGRVTPLADLVAYEGKHNPDRRDQGSIVDSSPYGVAATPDGGALVVDTNANAVIRSKPGGVLSTRAVFPARQSYAPEGYPLPGGGSAPSGITRGPDGQYYVTEQGGPFLKPGSARVFRMGAYSGTPQTVVRGFTSITDIAFDKQKRMILLASVGPLPSNLQPKSTLYRIEPNGTRTQLLKPGTLTSPLGITVGPDGAIYVTNKALGRSGEVLRVKV
ncbi:ScyD/ScyE family protein [Rhizohabitans arisaemae]|uniref:ScyD/ScyE family protein n=1 Tax=Rhizohabitans arisaemae TaxID=2720610 RepID=UPI0024B25FE9|nr:ScyD/ScyE family protein [Rhizohabitans arisaemae]